MNTALSDARQTSVDCLETPCLIVDYDRLHRNLRRMQALAKRHGVSLRPHIKTHKCLEIARLQLDHGATGLTASKVDEALVFIEAGFPSITVAYPVVSPRKADRLLAAATAHDTDLSVIVDSIESVSALADAARKHETELPTFLKVDVGLGRCGVLPESNAAVTLARRIETEPNLRFAGLLSHAGHAYGASDREGVRAIAGCERELMAAVKVRFEASGIEVPAVSVGSTPTVLASEWFDGITEIRPGNYVFMDLVQAGLGIARMDEMALSVLATVVSTNDEYLIIDAGSKVLSSDAGPHGTTRIQGFGQAYAERSEGLGLPIVKLSEEHGFVRHGGHRLPVGSAVRVVPNHACPVVNLADCLTVIRDQQILARWVVAARGRVR